MLHGDEFDARDQVQALALIFGGAALSDAARLNRFVHWRSRAASAALLVARATHQGARWRKRCATSSNSSARHCARRPRRGFDGVVCGHIHKADLVERDGLVYCNDGDWVESCTALVEDVHGELRLLSAWRPRQRSTRRNSAADAA